MLDLLYEQNAGTPGQEDTGKSSNAFPSLWRYRITPTLSHLTQKVFERTESASEKQKFALLRVFLQKVRIFL